MKKLLFISVLVLLVTFAFAARPVEIEVWTLSLSPTFDDYMNSVNEAFEEAYPDIKVNWVDVPYNAALQKLQAAIAANRAPDAVNLNTIWALDMVGLEALAPLDEYMNEVEIYRYWEKLMDNTRVAGNYYAIPWYASPQILIYNRQILEDAGLDPDNPPSTWDEMLQASRIIKERTGKYGFEPNIIGYEDLILEGVPLLSEDGEKAAFNTPEALAKLNWYITLYNEDLIPRSLGGYTAGQQNYSAGKIAMYPVGMSMLKHVQENSPSIYEVTDVAPIPVGEASIIKSPMMNMVVPINAPHPAEAVKYILWLTSAYWQVEFDKHATIVPSTKIGLEQEKEFQEMAKTSANARAQIMASSSMENVADIGYIAGLENEKYAEFRRIIGDYWMAAIKGEIPAQEALDKAEAEINELLQD
ncbi:MAG TPA: sugar ABC transporter substrate-binding protein [Thermotogota bacterium]|nr:sugar ABC transporter substrate-binding protein [Thermotogota bacterium]HRW92826.1 sugar ABC transporter substrate-binding protein [Thermotogota bacterium]